MCYFTSVDSAGKMGEETTVVENTVLMAPDPTKVDPKTVTIEDDTGALIYKVNDVPPFYLSVMFGFQVN